MDSSLFSFLKDWIIPLGSIIISVWFASSAKKDAEKADHLLSDITKAIKGWQDAIMESTIQILNSSPQVIEGRSIAARMQAIESLIKIMQERSSSQEGHSAASYVELMRALTNQISALSDEPKKNG